MPIENTHTLTQMKLNNKNSERYDTRPTYSSSSSDSLPRGPFTKFLVLPSPADSSNIALTSAGFKKTDVRWMVMSLLLPELGPPKGTR